MAAQIVAVHRDIESADWNLDAFHFVHHRREPVSQRDTTGGDPHQHETFRTAVRLEDLVGYPRACAGNLISVEDYARVHGTGANARRWTIWLGLGRAGT